MKTIIKTKIQAIMLIIYYYMMTVNYIREDLHRVKEIAVQNLQDL